MSLKPPSDGRFLSSVTLVMTAASAVALETLPVPLSRSCKYGQLTRTFHCFEPNNLLCPGVQTGVCVLAYCHQGLLIAPALSWLGQLGSALGWFVGVSAALIILSRILVSLAWSYWIVSWSYWLGCIISRLCCIVSVPTESHWYRFCGINSAPDPLL